MNKERREENKPFFEKEFVQKTKEELFREMIDSYQMLEFCQEPHLRQWHRDRISFIRNFLGLDQNEQRNSTD